MLGRFVVNARLKQVYGPSIVGNDQPGADGWETRVSYRPQGNPALPP